MAYYAGALAVMGISADIATRLRLRQRLRYGEFHLREHYGDIARYGALGVYEAYFGKWSGIQVTGSTPPRKRPLPDSGFTSPVNSIEGTPFKRPRIGGDTPVNLTQNNNMAPHGNMEVDLPAQMDHLPNGVSSASRAVHVGGNLHRPHHSNMTYTTQMSSIFNLQNDGYTGYNAYASNGFTSGMQAAVIVGNCYSLNEFVNDAEGVQKIGGPQQKNVFTFDPNQATTGSAYVTSVPTDDYTVAAAAGTNVVTGSRHTGQVWQPTIPRQDWINYLSVEFIYDLSNFTNLPFFSTFYVLKAKRDMTIGTDDPITCWDYGDQNFNQTFGGADLPDLNDTVTPYGAFPHRHVVHTVPTSSVRFNKNWEVIDVKPCVMAKNGSCKLKFKIGLNRTVSREAMELKWSTGVSIPKGNIQIMMVYHGGVVMQKTTGGADTAQPAYGYADLGLICTQKTRLGFVKSKEGKYKAAMMYSNQVKKNPTTAQSFMSGDTALTSVTAL